MSEQASANYPDVLGVISAGKRLNLDAVQCALAVRPAQAPAGKPFDLVLLLQNTSDGEVDVIVHPALPERDLARRKDPFTLKSTRIVCGLEAAQTGALIIPVLVAPTAQPGTGYVAAVELEVKRLTKKSQRIRLPEGGGTCAPTDLEETARAQIVELRALQFSNDSGGKKSRLQAPFTLLPPVPTSLQALRELQTRWVSLWTLRDFADPYVIAQRVWDPAQSVLRQLTRETLFMPLLKATQERFQASQYSLLPPEVILISKMLMLMLEMGVAEPGPANPRPPWPRWFTTLCRLLVRQPALATQIEPLVTRLLFPAIVYDAALYGFTMVTTVTREDFGTAAEMHQYADGLAEALTRGQTLDFARAYLPLVMAGLIANARVTMPREQVRETVFTLSKALEKRRAERTSANAFIFDLTSRLIERALDAV